jgi:hypothetical protein
MLLAESTTTILSQVATLLYTSAKQRSVMHVYELVDGERVLPRKSYFPFRMPQQSHNARALSNAAKKTTRGTVLSAELMKQQGILA